MMEMVRAWVRCGVEAYSDVTPKAAVTGGVVFALVVNLAAPFTAKRLEPTPTGQSYTVAVVEVVHFRPHHFDVGSFTGGIQWARVDGMRLPVMS
jgi:hypothetical protein